MANPPRLLAQIADYIRPHTKNNEEISRRAALGTGGGDASRLSLKARVASLLLRWQRDLFTIHFALFMCTRVLCAQFTVRVVWTHAASYLTIAIAAALSLFSGAALWEYTRVPTHAVENAPGKSATAGISHIPPISTMGAFGLRPRPSLAAEA